MGEEDPQMEDGDNKEALHRGVPEAGSSPVAAQAQWEVLEVGKAAAAVLPAGNQAPGLWLQWGALEVDGAQLVEVDLLQLGQVDGKQEVEGTVAVELVQ